MFASWFPLNGNGELTGTAWIDESGFLEGPVLLTNTHSVGVVRDAVVAWQLARRSMFQDFCYPVVGETYDGWLNDTNGFHVKPEHVFAALDGARTGPVAEGNVGGGTGMVSFGFKAGTGTASRVTESGHVVGVLVQSNFGRRPQLTIAGVPVGQAIPVEEIAGPQRKVPGEQGSILVIVATDAPVLPHQLARLARRAPLGLARTGGAAGNGSGDLMLAFSTANAGAARLRPEVSTLSMLANVAMNELFDATIQATEEAIVNALVAAETMTGIDDRVVHALPHARVQELLARHARLARVVG